MLLRNIISITILVIWFTFKSIGQEKALVKSSELIEWTTSKPKTEQINPFILEMIAARTKDTIYPNLNSMSIAKNGKLIFHQQFDSLVLHQPQPFPSGIFLHSLIGILISNNRFPNLETPLCEVLKKHHPKINWSQNACQISLLQLLNMTSGLQNIELKNKITKPEQIVKLLDEIEITEDKKWKYSNTNTVILEYLLAKESRQNINTLVEDLLFSSIKIQDDPTNKLVQSYTNSAQYDLKLLTIGQCYIDQGKYNNRQLIPQKWLSNINSENVTIEDNTVRKYTRKYRYTFFHHELKINQDVIPYSFMLDESGYVLFTLPKSKMVIVLNIKFQNLELALEFSQEILKYILLAKE